jgi:uncharacterized repeat protein (TIGR01451 family)
MCYGCTDMGYGVVAQPDNKVDALNLGSVTPKRPGARLIYTYPAVNQANVPREWNGAEVPDPLPGAPRPVGYPISLYIAQPSMPGSQAADPASGPAADPLAAADTAPQPLIRDAATVQASAPAWSVTAADLYTASGVQVPVVMLDQDTDVPKYLGADVVFLIPRQPLAADTTYVAHIAGTDSRGIPFDYRWAFSTGREVAAPDFTPTRMWADRPFPAAGDTVTVHVQLANNGPRAEQVAVRAALPAQASYVRGSAATSQGTVTGEGPLQFSVGVIEKGGRVELQFSLAVPVDAALPLALEPEIELTWSLGQLTRRIPVLAGGAPLYLPLTAR